MTFFFKLPEINLIILCFENESHWYALIGFPKIFTHFSFQFYVNSYFFSLFNEINIKKERNQEKVGLFEKVKKEKEIYIFREWKRYEEWREGGGKKMIENSYVRIRNHNDKIGKILYYLYLFIKSNSLHFFLIPVFFSLFK